MFNKKFSMVCLVGVISLTLLTGCSGEKNNKLAEKNEGKGDSQAVSEENVIDEKEDEDGFSEEANPVAGVVLSDFKAIDTEGHEVDAKVFSDHKVTLVNLWGTFCGPCIDEMPDIQKISEDYKDKGVQVIGIVTDGENNEETTKILEQLKVTYVNIIPDEALNKALVNKFDYVPATVFVDSEGKILDTFIPGSASEETFSSIIDGLIK